MLIFCGVMNEPYSASQRCLQLDEQLLSKIAENDMVAFEEFYHATERCLYAFVLSILKNHEDTLDIMQDTYLKIRAAAHLYQPMGKPMAWVFTIAKNLSMSKLRCQKQIDSIHIEDIENDRSFSYVTDSDDRLVLQAAMKILNEQEREVILLHAIAGVSHSEIAKYIGVPLSTALSKYYRGLQKLRKYLTEREVL